MLTYGFTCSVQLKEQPVPRITQPRADEPIRLVENKGGHVYRVTIDVSPKGAPRRQITRTYPTLKEARAFVMSTRESQARGSYVAPVKATLRDLCEDWLASKRDVRQITRNGYANALRPALDRLGGRPAQSLTRKDIDDLVTWAHRKGGLHGQPLSQRSISYLLGTLRQVLGYGVASGLLPTNVATGVKAPRRTAADHHERSIWTPQELVKFSAVAAADPWAAGLRLMLCGLRRSEVCAMTWQHVDLDQGVVEVAASRVVVGRETLTDSPKSAASARVVPVEQIWPGTVAILKAEKTWQAANKLAAGAAWIDSGLVVARPDGSGVHPDALGARWRTVAREADVPVLGPHQVRHVLASALHRDGVAAVDSSALLGHQTGTHLLYYVKASEQGTARAAERLGRLLADGC
jgi:integrase